MSKAFLIGWLVWFVLLMVLGIPTFSVWWDATNATGIKLIGAIAAFVTLLAISALLSLSDSAAETTR